MLTVRICTTKTPKFLSKQFGSRSEPTFDQAWSLSKLFAKVNYQMTQFVDYNGRHDPDFKRSCKETLVLLRKNGNRRCETEKGATVPTNVLIDPSRLMQVTPRLKTIDY